MKVWTSMDQVPKGTRSVVTIGNFDGMHQGHQKVIGICVDRARRLGVESVALTFDPHPIQVHHPEADLHLINPLKDRLDAMAVTGLDACLVVHYDESVYSLEAAEFAQRYLIDLLGVVEVVVGEDFRFGRNNAGDVDTLRALGRNDHFEVAMVTDAEAPEGRRWSSSWVRDLLAQGEVAEASRVLGRLHRIRGTVEHGHKRGRQLGFPTANLAHNIEGVVPGDGVYAGWLVRGVPGTRAEVFLPAVVSVGTNPQFDGQIRTVEAHVLGRSDLNLYDEQVAVTFASKIRSMMSFESIDELTRQMDNDLRLTSAVLGVGVSGRIDPGAVTAL